MYTDDFTALVRRFTYPSACIKYLKTRFGPADIITILDYSYPKRVKGCVTGHADFDWYTSSCICNFTINEQTEYGTDGVWAEESRDKYGAINVAHWEVRPTTGYIPVLEKLLSHGCLVPSKYLDTLMRMNTKKVVSPTEWRLLYVP